MKIQAKPKEQQHKVTSTTATYTITVNQYAKGEVIVEGDIKVTPTGGKASEHQEGQDIENTYDGKFFN